MTTPNATQVTIQGLQDHASTTDRHFCSIRDEFMVMSRCLQALDDANDCIVSQLQESTTVITAIQEQLGHAMGSADSNFVMTI